MGSKICMNEVCRAKTSSEWKKGWSLKSGGFATLCYNCGSAYENSVFCETFHSEESGWRECRICRKLLHCGCIASRYLHEYMDFGGIACTSCAKRFEINYRHSVQIRGDIANGAFVTKSGIRDAHPIVIENKIDDDKLSTERLMQLTKAIGVNDVNSTLEQFKREEPLLKISESGKRVSDPLQQCSSAFAKADTLRSKLGVKDMFESPSQPSRNFSLTTPLGSSSSTVQPSPSGIAEGSEQKKGSCENWQRTRHMTKPPKPSPASGPETNKGAVSQTRVARPPAEGRGRSQLLPRYWPRITDQELQQLSGDLKSTIVPLFEKILSASDAGRIGRLVLPKACAEAYFPSINQSEGIPIKIQDIKGKEWTFQFRFWPNNNSRMYVLEGVTPCIQNMQLQAGDTVIFSRRDPGGQLVIGCRKATNNVDMQDSQTSGLPGGDSPGEASFSDATDNLISNNGARASDDSRQQHLTMSEKKKAKNIKNKRLLMNNDDATNVRITWEEAQELFRPSPSAEPAVFNVEDYEFEEFEEAPVFGKRTVFISRTSGEKEQLAQCDSCSKWRRLPLDALIPANWTCSDNIWDSARSSCSAPEEMNPRDLDIFNINKDYKKRKISDSKVSGGEPSGLDALANAAVLGDNMGDVGDYSVGATTRHPRHRPGCTCIVCIQPPSGKGKHEPTCKCNVCLTVRRRFKTLMMRKKKRQSERDAELAQEKDKGGPAKVEIEREEDIVGDALLNMNNSQENNETNNNENLMDLEETNKGQQLDLNSDPHREDDILEAAAGMSLTTLMNAAAFPFGMFLGPNGLPGLGPCLAPQSSTSVQDKAADGDVEGEDNREDG